MLLFPCSEINSISQVVSHFVGTFSKSCNALFKNRKKITSCHCREKRVESYRCPAVCRKLSEKTAHSLYVNYALCIEKYAIPSCAWSWPVIYTCQSCHTKAGSANLRGPILIIQSRVRCNGINPYVLVQRMVLSLGQA